MTRHGKNSTASSIYSYSERRKDAKQSGYGTLNERLGADSMKPFDCCSLTLQPCREPLISPEGYIFDKEAILNYILDQKKKNNQKYKIWKEQLQTNNDKLKEEQKKNEELVKEKFLSIESTSTDAQNKERKRLFPFSDNLKSENLLLNEKSSNTVDLKSKELKSFWIPQLLTTVEETNIEKPFKKILCPLSGNVLKYKELLPVKFTSIDEEDFEKFGKMVAKKYRYICPITRDVLTNSTRCVYLKTSQAVVTYSCVEKIIKKDMIDPLCGKTLLESDIIELQRGGTGYSATNKLEAKLFRPQSCNN